MDAGSRDYLRAVMWRAKAGKEITATEQIDLERALKKWPDEYRALHDEVKNEAARSVNPWWDK